jgi:hypothetical protein
MLVEFIGWPGSGKSTIARALSLAVPRCRAVANWERRVQAARSVIWKGDRQLGDLVSGLCGSFAQHKIVRWRRTALLCGDYAIASAAQRSPRLVIADELLLHVLFGTVGPRTVIPHELLQGISSLVQRGYCRESVLFFYLRPSPLEWESRVRNRRAGGTRFGIHGDARLFSELQRDILLEVGFVQTLKRLRYQVVELPVANGDVASTVDACRNSLISFFSRPVEDSRACSGSLEMCSAAA